ncbi:MAG: hypothetical protein ACK2U9_09575, partial [Anaerolineae bacterium]
PATGLVTGLLAGFMTESYANSTTVDLPVIGTVTMGSLLPGGTGYSCTAPMNYDDRDVALDGLTTGWWFYMDFTAVQVAYSGP